ncbi:hypothetical protein V501_02375 [Pseudogymnoascus sp. VKM F-4519 (FW-2642)]|nr:hypothetical protein V501_02375 [Pseudogymnoascus sp. VKM F-4519 (FW-2642)]
MKRHVASAHDLAAKGHRDSALWREGRLQTYFTGHGRIDYFVVVDHDNKKNNKRRGEGRGSEGAADGNVNLARIVRAAEAVLRDAYALCSNTSPERKMTQQRANILNEFYAGASGRSDGFRYYKNASTLVKYFATFKQLLVYVFRVAVTNANGEDRHFTRTSPGQRLLGQVIRLTAEQVEALQDIAEALEVEEEEGGEEGGGSVVPRKLKQAPQDRRVPRARAADAARVAAGRLGVPAGARPPVRGADVQGGGPRADAVVEAKGRPRPRGVRGVVARPPGQCGVRRGGRSGPATAHPGERRAPGHAPHERGHSAVPKGHGHLRGERPGLP